MTLRICSQVCCRLWVHTWAWVRALSPVTWAFFQPADFFLHGSSLVSGLNAENEGQSLFEDTDLLTQPPRYAYPDPSFEMVQAALSLASSQEVHKAYGLSSFQLGQASPSQYPPTWAPSLQLAG